MGMRTVWSQRAMVAGESPSPSVPNSSASFAGSPVDASRSAKSAFSSSGVTESSESAMAAQVKPCARSSAMPSLLQVPHPERFGTFSSPIRVHGTWKTVPIDTRTARRYNGS